MNVNNSGQLPKSVDQLKRFFQALLLASLAFFASALKADTVLAETDQATLGDTPVILENGNNLKIEAGFELETEETAIIASGTQQIIENAGAITTKNIDTEAVYSAGDAAKITNETGGSITTEGHSSYGILSQGNAAKITNEMGGSITTEGHSSYGIYSDLIAERARITNAGSVITKKWGSYGIYSAGSNAEAITNAAGGSITTEGYSSYGIYSKGDTARITNEAFGLITTKGYSSYGIYSKGDTAKITNAAFGLIITEAGFSAGIYSLGDAARITNAGSVITKKLGSYGIYSAGSNAEAITNAAGGLITTEGDFSYGIYSVDSNAESITNAAGGSITTEGDFSYGIYSYSDFSRISNQLGATIAVKGHASHGITVLGNHNEIINNGVISILDNDANPILDYDASHLTSRSYGIVVLGNNLVHNNGTITVGLGNQDYAIFGDRGTTRLVIGPGSQVTGRIDLGGSNDGDSVLITGGRETHLVIENVEEVTFSEALKPYAIFNTFDTTTTIIITDPTVESTRGRAVLGLTQTLQNIGHRRLDESRPLGLTLSEAQHFRARAPLAWGQLFGTAEKVDADVALTYQQKQQGLVLGYERDSENRRLGLFGGLAVAKSKSEIKSFNNETMSTYLGVYGHFNLEGFNLSAALIYGESDHDSARFVHSNFQSSASLIKGQSGSRFLTPSLSLSSVYHLSDRLELRPSAYLDFSFVNLSSHFENGTNLYVKGRRLSMLSAQLQVAATYHLARLALSAHLGIGSDQVVESDIETRFMSQVIRYAPTGFSDESSGLIAGLGLRTTFNEHFSLAAGFERNRERLVYQLNLEYGF